MSIPDGRDRQQLGCGNKQSGRQSQLSSDLLATVLTSNGPPAGWPRTGSQMPSTRKICADPKSDIACGAVEPAVDEWEAGTRYPSFEQLLALAALTERAPDTFVARPHDLELDIRDTTMWGHMTKAERARWRPPIAEFTDQAVEECPGTNDYDQTRLF